MGLRTVPCIACHLFFTYSVFILLFWWMFITNNGLIKHSKTFPSVVLWVCVCLISISAFWKRGRDLKGEAVTHYPGRKLRPPWPPSLHVQRWVATLPTRFGHICMIASNQFIHSFFFCIAMTWESKDFFVCPLQSHPPLVQSTSCGSILPRMLSLSNKETESRGLHKGTNEHTRAWVHNLNTDPKMVTSILLR